jgi:radical SAM superfamily enzyme YgiQ (UPF0313 family)
MGRQPFGLASPAAWLRSAGCDVVCVDLSRERLVESAVQDRDVVALFLPMHTATRLALPVIDRVRAMNADATLVAYGLYAPLNEAVLRERGVAHVLGGEFEADLVALITGAPSLNVPAGLTDDVRQAPAHATMPIPRLAFKVPDRTGLPPLARYATLQMVNERRTVGYTEASRGCKHRCRHCPIVPVYDGRFRIVAPDIVLADVRAQVAAGARHITFGDPDFFNGIRHAEAVLRGFGREFPGITYDVTIKVEHLLEHAAALPLLRETGCAFVTSAVEAVDDRVLGKLEKGHTRADFERMVPLLKENGLTLTPTFLAFTPWTTHAGYLDLLHVIDRLDLVDSVAPIQLAIRLLVPQGSRMLELPDVRAAAGPFDPGSLTYPWAHPDPTVDALQIELARMVGARVTSTRRDMFGRIWDIAHARAGVTGATRQDRGIVPRTAIPYLNEPWYC